MERLFVITAAIFGFLAVAVGAFGAHGLKKYFELNPDMHHVFRTAVEYQMYHALALVAVAWAATRWPAACVHAAGYLFIAGILLFSGTLYALALTRVRWLGAITPIGGLAFLAGWICLAVGAWRGSGS